MSEQCQEPAKIIESCFCKACDGLLRRSQTRISSPVAYVERSFVGIQRGAADYCPFCTIIRRELLRNQPPNLPRDRYRVSIPHSSLRDRFALTVDHVNDFDPHRYLVDISLGFFLLKDDALRSAQLAASYEYPPKTDARSVAELIKSWFLGCKNHHKCGPSMPSYQPPRLLEIAEESFHLVDSKSPGVKGSYATLSHCWGSPPPFLKLTSANFEVLQQWAPINSLPRTFADAAKLCSFLSIRYLWIDSLCIIQEGKGSAEDWAHHVTEMQVIYSNSILNIAASHAASSSEGLWTSRNPDSIRPSVVKGSYHYGLTDDWYLLGQYGYGSPGWVQSPLNYRAWVLQERLLSPRVVHFESEQVHWECHDNRMCETYPAGLRKLSYYLNLPDFTLPEKYIFGDSDSHWAPFARLVEHYSQCKISYADTDKFAAFAGIAQHICQEFHDEYAAGFFTKLLPSTLLWSNSEEIPHTNPSVGHQPSDHSTGNTHYRAPSWSWAKMDIPVVYDRILMRGDMSTITFLEVQKLKVKPIELTSPFGRLESAHMIVRGRLLPYIERIASITGYTTSNFDGRVEACVDPAELLLLPVSYGNSYVCSLIVVRLETGSSRQCYKRVGLHMNYEERPQDKIWKIRAEELMLI